MALTVVVRAKLLEQVGKRVSELNHALRRDRYLRPLLGPQHCLRHLQHKHDTSSNLVLIKENPFIQLVFVFLKTISQVSSDDS